MADYGYTGMQRTPSSGYVHGTIQSSEMSNKSIKGCVYNTTDNMFTVSFDDTLNGGDKATLDTIVADSYGLNGVKYERVDYLKNRGHAFIKEQGYDSGDQGSLQSMYSDGMRIRAKQRYYVQPYVDWSRLIDENINSKIALVQNESSITGIEGITLDESALITTNPSISKETGISIVDDLTLESFMDSNVAVTGMAGATSIVGPYYLIELLDHRKDLYNDNENPLYDPAHIPILGENGIVTDHASRISNIETIHGKLGWHNQEVIKGIYNRPKDMLFYYGWLNSFNSLVNGWSNERVAQDMAKYDILIFGDGVQDPGHGDYANTSVIIPRVKALRPTALVFGYVSANQTLANFQTKVDQWDTLGVDGIFMDESGYDWGIDRIEFNDRVDYVHSKTYAHIAYANAWNTDHLLGTAEDVSYPNSTYNPGLIASNLASTDWVLLESFPINTTSYAGNAGYEAKADWAARGVKTVSLRATYGVNFAAVGVINNGNADSVKLFMFGYMSSMMFSLEAFGTSDTNYGSSSATVNFLGRPNTSDWGSIWNINPSVQVDGNDSDVYFRNFENVKIWLDFSAGEQLACYCKFVDNDPCIMPFFKDDFLGGSLETGEIGEIGWSFTNGSMQAAAAEQNHPGMVMRRTGTSANQVASFYPGSSVSSTIFRWDEFKECIWIIAPVTADADFNLRAGLTVDSSSQTAADGAYFERLAADTNWFSVTRASSSETRTDTGVALSASWFKFTIKRITHDTIEFWVNGVVVKRHTANIMSDSTSVLPFLQVVPTTTSARDVKIDYVGINLRPVFR